jgi:hypothetical protein
VNQAKNSCQSYTALFDLGREAIDGRTFQNYIDWLRGTSELFPGLIVFHDGQLEDLNIENAKLIRIDRASLRSFSLLSDLKKVMIDFVPHAFNDITFQLPEYGLIQLSKFELGCRVFDLTGADSVLWVDAGISRFLEAKTRENKVDNFSSFLLDNDYKYFLEIDTRKNFDFLRLRIKRNKIGTSKRVVAGGAFWVSSKEIESLSNLAMKCAEQWLEIGIWDNEQMILREVLPNLEGKALFYRKGREETGCVARIMLTGAWIPNYRLNSIYIYLLRK